jgi:tRNA dimethylallyltransferase
MRIAVVGSTASGKSAVAHEVARERGDCEIICVDAMTVYRGMDIGTAKPTPAERDEVAYHLLDVVDPSEEFSVAEFQRAARVARDEIEVRGHHVLYVGGTGLYGRAVIDDLDIPGIYPEIRQQLEERAITDLPAMVAELAQRDPLAASRIEPDNARRIVRALEVIEGTGRTFSSFGDGLTTYGESIVTQVGLQRPLEEMDRRVEARFREWMAAGFADEVRELLHRPGGLSKTAAQAVGYRELAAYWRGDSELESAVVASIDATRRLVRRQRRWFRRDPRIAWFETPEAARENLHASLENLGD